jgi:hypothetical protein
MEPREDEGWQWKRRLCMAAASEPRHRNHDREHSANKVSQVDAWTILLYGFLRRKNLVQLSRQEKDLAINRR